MNDIEVILSGLDDLGRCQDFNGDFEEGNEIVFWGNKRITTLMCNFNPPLLVLREDETSDPRGSFYVLRDTQRILKYRRRFGQYPDIELWGQL